MVERVLSASEGNGLVDEVLLRVVGDGTIVTST